MREFKDSVTGKDKEHEQIEPVKTVGGQARAVDDHGDHGSPSSSPSRTAAQYVRASCARSNTRTGSQLVEHLDELRSRLIFCAVAFGVAWAFTGWQNHVILEIVNAPLPEGDRADHARRPPRPSTPPSRTRPTPALLISMPVILYQLYAFVLPAFSPAEKRVAMPLLLMVPILFISGVVFCYYVVLTPALDFLLTSTRTSSTRRSARATTTRS